MHAYPDQAMEATLQWNLRFLGSLSIEKRKS